MFRKFLIVILSAACVMALVSCGTSVSAETAAEAAPEKAAAREDVTRAEWSPGDIEALSEVVSGITDREYAAGEGAAYKIHEDVTYDRDIVYTVLFNTASVRFDTPGEYEMTYWVYFDAAALKVWSDENGVDLDIPDTGRLAVWISATVTVTEAEENENAEDAEDDEDDAAEDTASGGSGDESASAGAGSGPESVSSGSSKSVSSGSPKIGGSGSSSKSASSGSSKSSGSGSSSKSASSGSSKSGGSTSVCDHNWVDEGHYESVLVQAAYDEKVPDAAYYVCNNCGFESTDVSEVGAHARANGCSGSYYVVDRYKTVHHDAVYKTQWVSSYKCSKCGATK